MSSFCSIGKKPKKLLYPLLAGFAFTIRRMATAALSNKGFNKHPFFKAWENYVSEATIFLVFLIQEYITKAEIIYNKKKNVMNSFHKYEWNKPLLLIFFFCALDFNSYVTFLLIGSN